MFTSEGMYLVVLCDHVMTSCIVGRLLNSTQILITVDKRYSVLLHDLYKLNALIPLNVYE